MFNSANNAQEKLVYLIFPVQLIYETFVTSTTADYGINQTDVITSIKLN